MLKVLSFDSKFGIVLESEQQFFRSAFIFPFLEPRLGSESFELRRLLQIRRLLN